MRRQWVITFSLLASLPLAAVVVLPARGQQPPPAESATPTQATPDNYELFLESILEARKKPAGSSPAPPPAPANPGDAVDPVCNH